MPAAKQNGGTEMTEEAKNTNEADPTGSVRVHAMVRPIEYPKTSEMISTLRLRIQGMTPTERLELVDVLMHGYCRECGFDDPNHCCQCWNDE